MAKQMKERKGVGLDPTVMRGKLRDYYATLDKLEDERDKLNAKFRGARDALKAAGINVAAANAARAYEKSGESHQEMFDATYKSGREALGCPIQPDLFAASEQSGGDSNKGKDAAPTTGGGNPSGTKGGGTAAADPNAEAKPEAKPATAKPAAPKPAAKPANVTTLHAPAGTLETIN